MRSRWNEQIEPVVLFYCSKQDTPRSGSLTRIQTGSKRARLRLANSLPISVCLAIVLICFLFVSYKEKKKRKGKEKQKLDPIKSQK